MPLPHAAAEALLIRGLSEMIDLEFLTQDPPMAAVEMNQFGRRIPSDGNLLFARCYKPTLDFEGERRPAVIIMHGFPGNEQYPDVSQAFRRAGFVVVQFTFRGAWGSYGDYRFSSLKDDALAVLAYIKENAEELSVDTDNIFYMGHSMGGFTALRALADGAEVKGAVLVAPCNAAEIFVSDRDAYNWLMDFGKPFLRFGEGKDVSVLYDEMEAHNEEWNFKTLAAQIDDKYDILIVGGEKDVLCPIPVHVDPILNVFRANNKSFEFVTFDSDHNIQRDRIAFIRTVCDWLIRHI